MLRFPMLLISYSKTSVTLVALNGHCIYLILSRLLIKRNEVLTEPSLSRLKLLATGTEPIGRLVNYSYVHAKGKKKAKAGC